MMAGMSADAGRAKPWRLSLRGLMVLVGAAAVACAGLMNANQWWLTAFTAAALFVFMAAFVAAVIDRGPRQAFAVGFLLCVGLHLAALRWMTDMPTRQLLEMAYQQVSRNQLRLTSSAAASSGQLKYGSSGPLVAALQEALNERLHPNPPLDVDGDFGQMTRQAVVNWQQFLGRPTTGVATLAEWRALGATGRAALKRHNVQSLVAMGPGEEFMPMGEWTATLVVGLVGGYMAQAAWLRRTRQPGEA
jgi:hypothetical protein